MKTTIVALCMLLSSTVFAGPRKNLMQAAKEVQQEAVAYDYKFMVAYEGRIVLISEACWDEKFVAQLVNKFAQPDNQKHFLELGVKRILCSYGSTELRLY